MDVPATDTDIPMPQVVSNSPTHSLPNVIYSGRDVIDSATEAEVARSGDVHEAEMSLPPGELEHIMTTSPPGECSTNHNIPPAVLQRAVSTSPRLEHTSDDTRPPEGTDVCTDDDLLFFPLMHTSQDLEKPVSFSSGCLDQQNGNVGARDNVRASDTVLSNGTTLSNGRASVTSLERIRSGLRRVMRFTSQPSAGNVENPGSSQRHFAARKDSVTSTRSGAGNYYGSSIFGSKLFESTSTMSIASQRVNVVADCPSVEPVLSGCYSVSCDESSFPRMSLSGENREPFAWRSSRFRTSSASSDVPSSSFPSSSENLSLQRTRSLPSRQAHHQSTSDSGELHGEVSDSVTELQPIAVASTSTTKRKWQMTMPELTEGPENETLTAQSQRRENLAAAALAIIRGEYKDLSDDEGAPSKKPEADDSALPVVDIRLEKRRYVKNLLVMSTAYFFLFSAYFGLRNLQSSLNAAGGLGLYALSSMYCSLVFGSLFSTTIVQRLRQKRTQSVSLIGFVLFSTANFYPRFYTMIPAAVVHGFFMAVGYTAQTTYLTNIAAGYAELVGKQTKHVLSQFHGTFFFFLQLSQIAGGLLSSMLLSKSKSDSVDFSYANYSSMNDSNHTLYEDNVSMPFCGRDYCPSYNNQPKSDTSVDQPTLMILMGCFAVSTVTGCVVMVFFLDPLAGEMKSSTSLGQQMTAVFRFFLQRRARLVIGLSFYSLLQITFMFGEFTKVVLFLLFFVDGTTHCFVLKWIQPSLKL